MISKHSQIGAVLAGLALTGYTFLVPTAEVTEISTAEPGPDATHQQILDSLARIEAKLGTTTTPPPTTEEPAPEPDPEPTTVPQNLTATPDQAARTIFLNWDDVPNASFYTVYERDSPQGLDDTTMSESTRGPLADNYTYRYWVTATVNGMESAASNSVDVTLGTPTTEEPPPTTEEPPPTTEEPPPTDPTPTDPIIPDTVAEIFNGDFNTGDFSQWSTIQQRGYNGGPDEYIQNDALKIINDGAGHETAARFEVGPGDVPPFGGGERSEITGPDVIDMLDNEEHWYSFDLKFDSFPPPEGENSGGHMIVMQWHTGSGSPRLTLNVDAAGNFTIGERWDDPAIIGPIDEGVWHSYVVHVKASQGSDGLIEVWRDGVLAASRNQATHADSDNYFKMGIYRAEESTTQSLIYDNFKVYK